MRRFPVFDKKISDLLPWAAKVGALARKLLLKSTVASMGALALGPTFPAQGMETVPNPISVAILNRDRRTSVGKLILQLGNRFDSVMRAAHRSHSSHSSHRSHSSHVSHYSSSTAPSPPYSPPPPAQPSPRPSPGSSTVPEAEGSMIEERTTDVVIDITSIDIKPEIKGSSLHGKDRLRIEQVFVLRPDTKIRRIGHMETLQQLKEILAARGSLPLEVGDKVLVAWKADPQSSQKIAVKITLFE